MADSNSYVVVDQEQWNAFRSQFGDGHASLTDARNAAVDMSEQEENKGKTFILVEEAGSITPEVERKVKLNFKSNRKRGPQGPRKPKADAEGQPEAEPATEGDSEGFGEAPAKGRKGRR